MRSDIWQFGFRLRQNVRLPGFEPGLRAWEAHVITAGPQPLYSLYAMCHQQVISFIFQFTASKIDTASSI